MRLHRLGMTAFGPFADATHVDFDALSEAGLFLLSGPTGAGKTSVLDAVCFAIYGDVPGDRSAAKRLRCDHAAPGVAPRVELEVTLAGRRFLVERSPAWTRPKRRGQGETQEHAKVVLSEHVDGQWQPLSTRLDEAGHLLRHLVGLSLSQFCQVALLPQGQFQAFLRARSEERQQLLQQVFRTQRFDQVEKWLRERRGDLRRDSSTREAAVADLVSRVSEVVGVEALAGWESTPNDLDEWCNAHATDVAAAVTRGRQAADLAA
ncbi:MAG: SMC family ATPase, partial [Nocardioides sp.]|nr:SMC family ATPase [Nocardioides sp.]